MINVFINENRIFSGSSSFEKVSFKIVLTKFLYGRNFLQRYETYKHFSSNSETSNKFVFVFFSCNYCCTKDAFLPIKTAQHQSSVNNI